MRRSARSSSSIFEEMRGTSAIGCISDTDPQPLLIRSNLGVYALCMVGLINNSEELIRQYLSFSGGHFDAMTGGRVNSTELAAALINQKSDFVEGIRFAQKEIEGSASFLILKEDGSIIVARDRFGRLPVIIGKGEDCMCASFESFAYKKLGCEDYAELGPGENRGADGRRMPPAFRSGRKDARLFVSLELLRLSEFVL